MRRSGIALLITIAFITAIAALIAVAGGILDRGFSSAGHKAFLVQSNVIFSDIYDLLRQNTKDINDSDTLDILLSIPLFFGNKKDGIMTDITFASDASTVNINHLIRKPEGTTPRGVIIPTEPAYEAYLDHILTFYNVSDPLLLISMIADTIDDDMDERVYGSEIAMQSPEFSQGKIFNMRHFRQILDAYKRQTLDFSVDTIPWEKLVGFRNASTDFNHITAESLRFMAPDIDDATLADLTTGRSVVYQQFTDLPLTPEDVKTMEDLNVTFYSPNVLATMRIFGDEQKVSYTFIYDLSTQKVSHFAIAR